ncbi:MAG: cupin domain-containing protein [Micromonosporaceae bacterium]|nr:cupin domain-containing protein [Micromonosporaceae bacterium]
MRHLVRYGADASFTDGSPGFAEWSVVDEQTPGAVHTGFTVAQLQPGAEIPARVHSFEECDFGISGEVVLQTPEGATLIRPGDYGLIPVGVPHSWRNESAEPARWARMLAPQPRATHDGDRLGVPPLRRDTPAPVNPRDPRIRRYGHIEPANMLAENQSQQNLAVSASMRTALLVYSGITVKMMVDTDLGAQLTTMFMVRYAPDGVAGPHDHPFEETYMFLEGRAEGVFDGKRYELGPGDVAWAGVGCVHSFRNLGSGELRWLETQAPQPPARHSYRFARDWDYLRGELENG